MGAIGPAGILDAEGREGLGDARDGLVGDVHGVGDARGAAVGRHGGLPELEALRYLEPRACKLVEQGLEAFRLGRVELLLAGDGSRDVVSGLDHPHVAADGRCLGDEVGLLEGLSQRHRAIADGEVGGDMLDGREVAEHAAAEGRLLAAAHEPLGAAEEGGVGDARAIDVPAHGAEHHRPLRCLLGVGDAAAGGPGESEVAGRAAVGIPRPLGGGGDVEVVEAVVRRRVAAQARQPLVHELRHPGLDELRSAPGAHDAPRGRELGVAAEPAALAGEVGEERVDHRVAGRVVGAAAVVVGDADLGRIGHGGEHLVVRRVAALGEQDAETHLRVPLPRKLPRADAGSRFERVLPLGLAALAIAVDVVLAEPHADVADALRGSQ